jgi:hypothetical protein
VHVDDLDHVTAEQGQMLLGHRLHGDRPSFGSNGPGTLAFHRQWDGSTSVKL